MTSGSEHHEPSAHREPVAPPKGRPAPGSVTVDAPSIAVTGEVTDASAVFHSIPFATIPGPFRPSETIPRHTGPAEAKPAHDGTAGDKDATALTLWVPRGTRPGDDLPVVAYIHGGSYEEGSHEDERVDGAAYNERGVILASIGYRLKLEGFAQFHDDPEWHFRGTDDARNGLFWLARNIEAFGGDPTNITLMGQSAGGGAVLWLTRKDHLVPGVQRVIPISPAFPRVTAKKRKGKLRAAMGVPVTREHFTRRRENNRGAFDRGYRRYRLTHPLDVPVGPAPFIPGDLAELPRLITVTHDEFHTLPAMRWLDSHRLGGPLFRPGAQAFALNPPARSYLDMLPDRDREARWVQLASDALVRRWAAQTLEEAPGRSWLLEWLGDGDTPAEHSGDLPHVFGKHPASGPILDIIAGFARGEEPGWERSAPGTGRKALGMSIVDGSTRELSDPLRSARLGFCPRPGTGR